MSKNIISSIILAITAFVLIGLAFPAFRSVMDARTVLSARQDDLSRMREAQNNIDRLYTEYQSRESEVATVSFFLPKDKRAEYVISSIDAAATVEGMRVLNIDISDPSSVKGKKYVKLPVSVSVFGPYQSFVPMLENLERSLRLYDIKTISIEPEDESGASVNVNMELDTYYLD